MYVTFPDSLTFLIIILNSRHVDYLELSWVTYTVNYINKQNNDSRTEEDSPRGVNMWLRIDIDSSSH